MNKHTRILSAIEALGTYVDFYKGVLNLDVSSNNVQGSTIVEVASKQNEGDDPVHVIASIGKDGDLAVYGELHPRFQTTTANAVVKVLSTAFKADADLSNHDFSSKVSNYADRVEISVSTLARGPGGLLIYRVSGDEVSIIRRGR